VLLTYLLILAVVVAVLYASYRALSGGTPVAAEDYRAVLLRICDLTGARAAELASALEGTSPSSAVANPGASPRPTDAALGEAAAAFRKQLGGYHEQLGRLETEARGAELDRLETARSLLTAAVEDLAWACRLIEGGAYGTNTGIQGAVTHLREHAGACLDAAASALGD
jgi:hypothetical protein